MQKEITSVVIDGVTFVPEVDCVNEPSIMAGTMAGTTDCDGHGVHKGERVYVRLSALYHYPNLTSLNRHGQLESFNDWDSTLTIQFGGGNKFTFPRNQVRRNPVQ